MNSSSSETSTNEAASPSIWNSQPAKPRRSRRFWIARGLALIVLLAIGGVVALLSVKDKLDFDGSMSLRGVTLDFTKGSAQDRRVSEHRAVHQSAAALPVDPRFAALKCPAFRGDRRDGIVNDGVAISTDWKANPPRELWRQPVGEGYASFVIGDGRLYTIEQRAGNEVVACYDAATGREIWTHSDHARFKEAMGGDGPRATPTLDGKRLYSLGATGILNCLSTDDGKLIWTRNILNEFDAGNLSWAMAGSPLIVDDKVVVTNSGDGGGSLIALDRLTGKTIWTSDRGAQAYSSPMLATLCGRQQILNFAAGALNAVAPEDGKLLWSFPWVPGQPINCSQPVVVDATHVFISSGYGKGAALIELKNESGAIKPAEVWANIRMKNKFASSVLRDGYIYGLDEGRLGCIDAKTGERVWRGDAFGHGALLLVGDHLLILSEEGALALVPAMPDAFVEWGSLQILNGRTWNNPMVAGGYLFARNHKDMVCYDLRGTTSSK